MHWAPALASVLANPATWPGFFVNVGIAGSYLAFAGLWAVPYLEQTYGMSRVVAAEHTSLLLLGVAFGVGARGMAVRPAAQSARRHARLRRALRAVVAAVAAARAVAAAGNARVVRA